MKEVSRFYEQKVTKHVSFLEEQNHGVACSQNQIQQKISSNLNPVSKIAEHVEEPNPFYPVDRSSTFKYFYLATIFVL